MQINPRLYEHYLKEMTNRETVYTHDGNGFISFEVNEEEKFCYVLDIYAEPKHRKLESFKYYLGVFENDMKERGMKDIYLSVNMTVARAIKRLALYETFGFVFHKTVDHTVIMVKGI